MTAFSATYADWKLIKTRACVQVVFEIPVEQSDAAYQLLGGMPVAAREVWCGIARLTSPHQAASTVRDEATPRPVSHREPVGDDVKRRRFNDLHYATQAALRGDDPIYRAFLRETCGKAAGDADEAAEDIRDLCGVESRRDIRPETDAEKSWLELERLFTAWTLRERVGA
jgi:hypothetical protein